jgi:hypothetical protein
LRTYVKFESFSEVSLSSVERSVHICANSVFVLDLGIIVNVFFGDISLRTLTDELSHHSLFSNLTLLRGHLSD